MNVKIKIAAEEIELTPKSKLMGELYVGKDFFGNGVQSYIEAYKPDKTKPNWYNNAKSAASENLTKPNLCKYINHLLEEVGLTDQFADKQLLFMITQHSDLNIKLGAVKEYNKLKARITKNIVVTETKKTFIKRIIEGEEIYEEIDTV